MIIEIIKIVNDLEQIGDEAKKTARMTVDIVENDNLSKSHKIYLKDIKSLSNDVIEMIKNVIKTFTKMNADAAMEVVAIRNN